MNSEINESASYSVKISFLSLRCILEIAEKHGQKTLAKLLSASTVSLFAFGKQNIGKGAYLMKGRFVKSKVFAKIPR